MGSPHSQTSRTDSPSTDGLVSYTGHSLVGISHVQRAVSVFYNSGCLDYGKYLILKLQQLCNICNQLGIYIEYLYTVIVTRKVKHLHKKIIYTYTHTHTHIYIYVCVCVCIYIYIYEDHKLSFQTFLVWALLLMVHIWNSSPLWSNLFRLKWTCCTVTTTSGTPHGSLLMWAYQWPSSQPLSSPQFSHNDSFWA